MMGNYQGIAEQRRGKYTSVERSSARGGRQKRRNRLAPIFELNSSIPFHKGGKNEAVDKESSSPDPPSLENHYIWSHSLHINNIPEIKRFRSFFQRKRLVIQ